MIKLEQKLKNQNCTTENKPMVIFETKGNILTARDINEVRINPTALQQMNSSKMTDLLGLKVTISSPTTVIEAIPLDPNKLDDAFFDLAFGCSEHDAN